MTWFAVVALLLAADGGAPQKPEPKLTASVRGESTLVLKAARAHRIVLPIDEFGGLSDAKIGFIQRAPEALYLLVWTQSLSGGQPEGQCGAGEEDDVVWLELAPDFKVRRGQAVRIESCWHAITSDERCLEELAAGKPCGLETFEGGDKKSTVSFDPSHPERGLSAPGTQLHVWGGAATK